MFNQKNFYSNMWVLRARPLSHDWKKKKRYLNTERRKTR